MNNRNIQIALPVTGEEEWHSVQESIMSGWLTQGPKVAEFEKNPNLKEIIAVRYLDEAGKIAGMETPDFRHFAPRVQRLVDAHMGRGSRKELGHM